MIFICSFIDFFEDPQESVTQLRSDNELDYPSFDQLNILNRSLQFAVVLGCRH